MNRLRPTKLPTRGLPVFGYEVVDHEAMSDRLVATAMAMQQGDPEGVTYDDGRTWHSATDLHTRPETAELQGLVAQAIDERWPEARWAMTALWANVAPWGSSTRAHAHWGHANAIFGGVYFARAARGSGPLRLWSPDRRLVEIGGVRLQELGPFAPSPWVDLSVKTGMLLLFPSWLAHAVLPHRALDPRVTWTFLCSLEGLDVECPPRPDLPEPRWEVLGPGDEPT